MWAPPPWGLIVGSSSGFGAAASLELARSGLNILGVHFDRRSNMPQVEQVMARIREAGRDVLFFNINAADPAQAHGSPEPDAGALEARPAASTLSKSSCIRWRSAR